MPAEEADTSTRVLLKDQAHEEIKNLILTGVYPPGRFLSERQLASKLGMSKTPIRSAIERLEAEGFVSVSPQQGIVVREMSLEEVVDHFDMRVALETFVVRRIAGQLGNAETSRLEENLRAQKSAAAKQDVAQSVELDADFHLMLCEFLGNREILRAMWHQRDKLNRIVSRVLSQKKERMMSSYKEHAAIAEAVMRGEGELAAARMEEHLGYGKFFLVSK